MKPLHPITGVNGNALMGVKFTSLDKGVSDHVLGCKINTLPGLEQLRLLGETPHPYDQG
jgi:hypothetical protein